MTGPYIANDWPGDLGRQQGLFEQELAAFNANRERMISSVFSGGRPQQESPVQQAAARPVSAAWRDEDLVAAAGFWDIPEDVARSMPRYLLINLVEQKRAASRQEGTSLLAEAIAPFAMVGIGAAEAVTGGLQKLPGVGEWFAKQHIVHDADQAVRQLEEGLRASTPEEDQFGLSVANVTGNVAALWTPAGASFRLAEGLAGGVPLIARTAIGRAAFAGGVSSYLLEGGSPEFKEHPVESLAFGSALGAGFKALEPVISAVAGKLAKRFLPPAISSGGPPQGPWPSGPLQGPRTGVPGTPYEGPLAPQQSPASSPPPEIAAAMGLDEMSIPTNIGQPDIPSNLELMRREPEFAAQWEGMQPEQRAAAASAAGYEEVNLGWAAKTNWGNLSPIDRTYIARGLAIQMNKVGAVMESPALPELANRADIGESTVATAMQATNPGGTNILQGVSNPEELFRANPGIRFARRGNRLDALVGDNITPQQVSQYEEFGLYQGQRALDQQGNEVVVNLLFNQPVGVPGGRIQMAEIVPPASIGVSPKVVTAKSLDPLIASAEKVSEHVGEPIWNAFNQFADAQAAQTNAQIGASLAPEHVFATRQKQLSQYLTTFLDKAGIDAVGDRARVSQYINDRFIESYAAVAPEEAAKLTGILQFPAPNVAGTPLSDLDQAAARKGMLVVPDGRTGKLRLVTPANEAEIEGDNMDGAADFLRLFNRDLPDITPPSSVPLEIAHALPTEATQASGSFIHDSHLVEAARDLDAAGGGITPPGGGHPPTGGGGGPPEGPEEATVKGLIDKGHLVQALEQGTSGFARWRPMGKLMSELDKILRDHSLNLDLYKDYSDALQAHDNSVTWKAPWQREIGTILADVRRSVRDNGTWTRIWQISDPAARIEMATKAGFSSREIASLHEADAFLDRMLGPGASGEISDYISHVAERQSRGLGDKAWEEYQHIGPAKNFADVYGNSAMNLRDVSPDLLFAHIIGAEGWTRYVNETFTTLKAKWSEVGKVAPEIAPASDLLGNWLKSLRYGYEPTNSLALDAGHVMLQTLFGPEVTRQQTRQFFAGGLSATQQALLGFKPHVIVRDGLRLMFALPKQGTDLVNTVRAFMTGGAETQEAMWRFAMERGIVTQQASSIHPPGYFEAPPSPLDQPMLSGEGGSLRHRIAQSVYYNIADNLPPWLRDPTPGKFSPLYWVSKQAEMMRMLVGNAQYAKTARALGTFREAGEMASTDQLLGESAIRTLPNAVQNTFLQHVASGNDEAALTFAARSMVDNTMFRYGHLESPLVAKSISGRIALQLGNFGLHTWQYLRTGLQEGTMEDKAKLILGFGGLSAALWAAQQQTGWKFVRMSPLHGIGFTGGPWLEPAVEELSNLGSTIQYMQGTDSPTNRRGFDLLTQAPGRLANMVNPLAGLVRGAEAVGTASQSPSPGMSLLRYGTTGEVTNTPDVEQQLAPQAQRAFEASLQPMSNPVRGDAFGTTMPPPQMPIQSPWIKSPQAQYLDFVHSLPDLNRRP